MLRAAVHLLDAIRTDCDRQRPLEACGLLLGHRAGDDARLVRSVPTENAWPNAGQRTHRFAIDPLTQMKAEQAAAADGLDVVGFYHSHPKGLAVPSQFDLSIAWPKYVYLILGYDEPPRADGGPTSRAWVLDDGGAFVEHRIDTTD